MPQFSAGNAGSTEVEADLLVVGATKDNLLQPAAAAVDEALGGDLAGHIEKAASGGSGTFEGKVGHFTILPTSGRIAAGAVMVVGLGEAGKLDHEMVRRAAGVAARAATGYPSVALDIVGDVPGGHRAAAEGFALGAYQFDRYLTRQGRRTDRVVVLGADPVVIVAAAIYSEATEWARDLVNEPPSNRGPAAMADRAAERAREAGLRVEILDEKALADMGMNGIVTVGKGSASPPRLLILTYEPEGATTTLGLVGKGITFDSGGLSLKSTEGMATMKMDCSGAAAVMAAVCALPALAPKVKVIAVAALAENMPSGTAVKPGDIIRHYGGRTSEVLNTDAEGRLVLADALAWMAEQEPDAMVDLATLTGAIMVALGRRVAGVFASSPGLVSEFMASSESSGEALWPMPLVEDYRALIATPVADVKNMPSARHGGAISAGLFLKEFVGDANWAHLDIAGPAWIDQPEHYLSAGASGFGVRLLLDWVRSRAG